MKKGALLIAITIIAIATSMMACAADGGYGSPLYPGGSGGQGNQQLPPYPSNQQGTYPPGQGTYPPGQGSQNQQGGQTGQASYVAHPSTGPQSEQPQTAPTASTGKVESNLGQGQSLTKEQVTQIGGEPTTATSGGKYQAYLLVVGLEQWALYNGYWTKDYSAVSYYGRENILVYNDQYQYVWAQEKYPDGHEDWYDWGYLREGYYNRIFVGDEPGWHELSVWGSESGWSNVLWIYVWDQNYQDYSKK